jgi:hypothetical protein
MVGIVVLQPIEELHTASVERFLAPIKHISTVEGVSPMTQFIVAIDRITYYAVQAEDEVTAIDLALEGQGEEVTADTRDAYISEYQGERRDPMPRRRRLP